MERSKDISTLTKGPKGVSALTERSKNVSAPTEGRIHASQRRDWIDALSLTDGRPLAFLNSAICDCASMHLPTMICIHAPPSFDVFENEH